MAQKERYRLRFPFWLDMNKPDEAALADDIELLKNERSFARTVRDGIRLIISLRQRDLSVLYELFPWTREVVPTNQSSRGDDLKNEFESLRKLILEQTAVPAPPAMNPVNSGLTPLTNGNGLSVPGLKPLTSGNGLSVPGLKPLTSGNGVPIRKPIFDEDGDDLPALTVKAASGGEAMQNFMNCLMSLSN